MISLCLNITCINVYILIQTCWSIKFLSLYSLRIIYQLYKSVLNFSFVNKPQNSLVWCFGHTVLAYTPAFLYIPHVHKLYTSSCSCSQNFPSPIICRSCKLFVPMTDKKTTSIICNRNECLVLVFRHLLEYYQHLGLF